MPRTLEHPIHKIFKIKQNENCPFISKFRNPLSAFFTAIDALTLPMFASDQLNFTRLRPPLNPLVASSCAQREIVKIKQNTRNTINVFEIFLFAFFYNL